MVTDAISHLRKILPVDIGTFPVSFALPMYLSDLYELSGLEIAGTRCIAAANRDNDASRAPAQIKAHMAAIERLAGMPAIYVSESIRSWNRDRLIAQRVQFIVPGNQAYLPALAMDLREHYLAATQPSRPEMSPAAQVVLIALLGGNEISLAELANATGYARMSVSRALDELEAGKLVVSQSRNRTRHARCAVTRDQALKAMPSPVKARFFADEMPAGVLHIHAGLAALERRSMIAANHPVVAISQASRKHFREELPAGPIAVEVWRFDPAIFSENGTAGLLPLYLSLREDQDERVQRALNEMMEETKR